MSKKNYLFIALLTANVFANAQIKINRQALVERHTVINKHFDSLSSLSVGNGGFAFTVDVTGLQSFPEAYSRGVPLGTQSEWGWHSFKNSENFTFEETLKDFRINGRDISYSVQVKEPERNKNAVDWFRQNPHRLQLGNVGLEITLMDGRTATIEDIKNISQSLNMWTGEIRSHFTVDNIPVDVVTYGHQQQDAIAAKVTSPLIIAGRLQVSIRFPFPTGQWTDAGVAYGSADKHVSTITTPGKNFALLQHRLDTTTYYAALSWKGTATAKEKSPHNFLLKPSGSNSFEFGCLFTPYQKAITVPSFAQTSASSKTQWLKFWHSGGAVDFSGSMDKRAKELERRIILSQYLTRIQCAGNFPPQETGLTYNSWYGRPHMEMHWWHGIHFSLWGRNALLEKSLGWYKTSAGLAREIAMRQGFDGVRWQKMTDNAGNEGPSSVGAFLIWQQPHFIYFAELAYRDHPDAKTVSKYKDLVFATADFMASYAYFDSAKGRYMLGPGLIPAQERFKASETINPSYELVYWHWALNLAQQWRLRSGLQRNEKWDKVVAKLSPLPVQDKRYLFTESGTDSYSNPEFKTDHPSVLGALGMMPQTKLVDTALMRNTFDWIWTNWSWPDTWGWDFPMVAMTATRLGLPDKAVDALMMPVQTNTYLNNGHNYQDNRLTLYMPGNGGLLAAVAMMCAGYYGNKINTPGFPKNNLWKVKWENMKPMP